VKDKMGMYTTIVDSEVNVIDMEGLKKFLKNLKAGKNKDYIVKDKTWADFGKNRGKQYAEAVKLNEKEKILDFMGLDGWKIISYWYDMFVQFLRDIAVFLEGEVTMEFETNDEGGYIEFRGGKCIIHTGVMDWSEHLPEDFNDNLPPLNKELKSTLVARRL